MEQWMSRHTGGRTAEERSEERVLCVLCVRLRCLRLCAVLLVFPFAAVIGPIGAREADARRAAMGCLLLLSASTESTTRQRKHKQTGISNNEIKQKEHTRLNQTTV